MSGEPEGNLTRTETPLPVLDNQVTCLGVSFSALFPDVVNCMQTDNLELKKLVYLYLMNYAKSQPDMAIMAVNTFVKVKLQPPSNVRNNDD